MSMEINGNHNYVKTNYAERMKEEQQIGKTKKEEEAEKTADKASAPQDEYISSEKSGKKPSGLYRLEQDEKGNRKIVYDDPKKAQNAKETEDAKENKSSKVEADNSQNQEERCVGNTDKVDREIEKLKEKKKQLEQEIASVSGDEQKMKELERKLAQVESELSQKDNDTYRKQNSSFTG